MIIIFFSGDRAVVFFHDGHDVQSGVGFLVDKSGRGAGVPLHDGICMLCLQYVNLEFGILAHQILSGDRLPRM